jgi:hypothetical protein
MTHDDHERFHDDCTACQAEMEASYREFFPGRPQSMSRAEREEVEADTELMASEFHGRDLDGNVRW